MTISATGTPDHFTWTKDGGSASAPVALTGSAQTLTDGVTITFATTTGHTLAANWTITATASGSISSSSFVQRGLGATVARNAQDKLRETLSAQDFGADLTGAVDASTAVTRCMTQASALNGLCDLGAGKILLTNDVVITISSGNPNAVYGLIGHGANQPGSLAQKGIGTQINCAKAHPTTGDPTAGCIHIHSTTFTNPTYVLRDFTMIYTGTSGQSANALMIDGSSGGQIDLDNVQTFSFNGTGVAGIWVSGPEGNNLTNFAGNSNDQCIHLTGSANASTIVNMQCNLSVHDQVYIENAETILIVGGTIQSGQKNGLHLRGVLSLTDIGTHFENGDTSCAVSSSAYQGIWSALTTYSAGQMVWYSARPSGSYDYTSGNGYYTSNAGGNLNNNPASSGAWTLLTAGGVSDPTCRTKTAADGTPIGYGSIVIEAGAVSAGGGIFCDAWGLNCSTFSGGFNEQIVFLNNTMNSPKDQAYVFNAGGASTSSVQFSYGYVNPTLAPTWTYDSSVIWTQNRNGPNESNPQTNQVYSTLTLQELNGVSGNSNMLQFQSWDGLYFSGVNHFYLPTGAPLALKDIFYGQQNGTQYLPFTIDYANLCIALGQISCSATYSADAGSKGINTQNGYYVVGTKVADGTSALVTGGAKSCAGGQHLQTLSIDTRGVPSGTCN